MSTRVSFWLGGGLSSRQCDTVFDGALAILERTGIEVPHEAAIGRLAGWPGLTLEGSRVRLNRRVVDEAVTRYFASAPAPPANEPGDGPWLMVGGEGMHFVDPATGEVRPTRIEDVVTVARLTRALGLRGSTPAAPAEGDPRLRNLLGYKLAVGENPDLYVGVNVLANATMARAAYEMSRVVGQGFGISTFTGSPLCMDRSGLDCILAFEDEDLGVSVHSMPMYGATAPLDAGTFLAQGFAEMFGGVTIVELLLEGKRAHLAKAGIDVTGFDMRRGGGAYGSPEQLLLVAAYRQCLTHFAGSAPDGSKLLTMGKLPDAQSAAERAMGVMFLSLAGVRAFGGGGRICMSEVCSPVQLIIDLEICRYVRRLGRGLLWRDEGVDADLVDSVGPHRTYLDSESVLAGFREEIHDAEVFSRESVQSWLAAGGQSVEQRARERMEEALAAAPPYEADASTVRELERIFRSTAESLGG